MLGHAMFRELRHVWDWIRPSHVVTNGLFEPKRCDRARCALCFLVSESRPVAGRPVEPDGRL